MFLHDLAFAVRTLRRSPVFTAAAALTIAVGIGASTAIFSVTHAVLLRPLPYEDPGRLVVLYMDLRARSSFGMPFSNENFVDIRDGSPGSIEDMAAFRTARQVLPAADGTPEQIRVAIITVNFFRLMGGRIALGRDFEDADGRPQPSAAVSQGGSPAPPGPPLPTVAIISHDYWQRRYGGNPGVVGTRLPAGPRPEIVGILSPGFELHLPPGTNVEQKPDIWIANRLGYDNANRNTFSLRPIGRLKPGATLERAQEEVEAVAARIRNDFAIAKGAGFYARLEPMHQTLVEQVRPAILALMGAVIFLLLIACANVANLILVRASLRAPELAMRAALGAGRSRIVRQMLVEAILLTGIGAVLGLTLASLGIRELLAIAPSNLPRAETIRIDPIVLAFTGAITLGAAFVFGMVPAWNAFRLDLLAALSGGGRTWGLGGGRRFRNAVVVIEVALCFVLLVGSGLMFRSFVELQRVNPGFDPRGLLTFQLLGGRGGPPGQRGATTRQLEDRLGAIPGVQGVTVAFRLPLAGGFSPLRWGLEDALADTSKFQAADWQMVRPGYFELMRVPLLAGRTFTDDDNHPERNLVVVDEVLAAKAFPNQPAVGKRILVRVRTAEPEWVDIIGVVGHQRATSLAEAGREQVFFADGFLDFGAQYWALRTPGNPSALTAAVRAAVAEVDPQFLIVDLQPMDTLVARAQAGTRFSLMLIAAFAVMAALLVSVGLYGVLSTVVRQRTAEIGVRMALGASPNRILRLVVGEGLRLSAAGIALGLAAALVLTRGMTTMLVGVKPGDPATFVAMGTVFVIIAGVASWLPARRAAGLAPTTALRG
ncbi:MAG TPA: ABC transporter permease [Vicinamibacterales bacterium]|nr:ABC transporter permease [Vicinamibacterales bacterium]